MNDREVYGVSLAGAQDEGAVDLQIVHRKLPQVVVRGKSRPEIVDRKGVPQTLEIPDEIFHQAHVLDGLPLGDLEGDAVGGNRKAGHGLHDPVGEIGGGHGKRRHVEEELSGKTPLGGLLKGLLEDGEVQ